MPALSTVILTTRLYDSVAETSQTYYPTGWGGQNRDVAILRRQQSDAGTLGDRTLTASFKQTNGKLRTKLVLAVPIVQTETINGVDRDLLLRTGYAEVNFTFSMDSTKAERDQVVSMIASGLDQGKILSNAIVEAEQMW